ncbi:hypothetical protein IQ243_00105 [Nostocales cyanobacterium LEGE 11386]|nr:hypothetical protein [Nostocales cyanobacterium LEGE 11386]
MSAYGYLSVEKWAIAFGGLCMLGAIAHFCQDLSIEPQKTRKKTSFFFLR